MLKVTSCVKLRLFGQSVKALTPFIVVLVQPAPIDGEDKLKLGRFGGVDVAETLIDLIDWEPFGSLNVNITV